MVAGAFAVDYKINPPFNHSKSMPRSNWPYERDYLQIGTIDSGACGFVYKAVKRSDPKGKQYAVK